VSQLAVHFTPRDVVGTRHAASALCALAGIAATWKMAERLVDRRAGLVAAALLASTPVWIGHGLFNPKDIPFGAAAAWGVWGMLRIATDRELPSFTLHALCGGALGAALGVRPGGMFMLAYPLIAWLGRWWLLRSSSQRQELSLQVIGQAGLRLAVCWTSAWLCMLAAWPWAQLSPLRGPVEALHLASHSPWGGTTLFDGAYVSAQNLPASYLPVWFAVTLPETYFLAGLCALALAWRALQRRRALPTRPAWRLSRPQLAAACLAVAAFGPIAAQIAMHSTVYDAHRHFLFVLPPFAALAGAAITRFLIEPGLSVTLRAATLGALLGAFGVLGYDMVRLHPYEYVYFNHLVGGLPGAASRFETEYWGSSYTEGMRWLADQLDPRDVTPVRVATCNHDESVRIFLDEHPELAQRVKLEKNSAHADILLATTRYNCHKSEGEVLHVVQRMGVPFLYVLQRRALVSNGDHARNTDTEQQPGAGG